MGAKVSGFDFSAFKKAMLDKGIVRETVEASWADLLVLLHATEDTGLAHAVTEGADLALHHVTNDTVGLLRLSAAVFGVGTVLVHAPHAYGTPEFDAAWQRSRAAFAKGGVDLPEDYRSDVGNFRSAANCLVVPSGIADIQMAA